MKPSYATGAALPNEVIAIIVTSFLGTYIPGEIPLGPLSLVCRFWAKKLRRRIFSPLEIRSRDAFKQLLELLGNPGPVQPSISQCIFMVRLRQEGLWGDPWLHHVQAELSKHVPRQIPFYITLENTSTPYHQASSITMYAPSTLSTALPRTLPSACFPFQSLYLNDLRFRRIFDLLRLIDLAHLQSLWLKNITIEQTTDWVPGIRRRRPDVAGVYVSRSGAVEHELKIASYLLWHTRKGYPLDFSTWNILRDITISWLPPALTDIHVGMDTSTNAIYVTIDENHREKGLVFTFNQNSVLPSITDMRISFAHEVTPEEITSFRWQAFEDEVYTSFNGGVIPTFVIHIQSAALHGTHERSRSTFKSLVRYVAERHMLTRLFDDDKLDIHYKRSRCSPALPYRHTPSDDRAVTLREVIQYPSQQTVDDHTVSLNAVQRLDLILSETVEEGHELLRRILEESNCIKLPANSERTGEPEH